MYKLKTLYILLAMLAGFVSYAQQNGVTATLDKDTIKIGAQANLTIKATVNSNTKVNFPTGKSFGMLEVLEAYPTDTVKKGALLELSKKYGITQFDPGKYTIPPLTVVIGKKLVDTKPVTLEVKDVVVDTLKQKMYDIKPVIAGPAPSLWWLYVLIAIAVGVLGYFGWKWYKKRKPRQKKGEVIIELSPIEKATTHLQELEQKSLLQKGAVKEYYSELTDIARTYIEEAIEIPAMESTTGELIEAMQKTTQKKKSGFRKKYLQSLKRCCVQLTW
ncbi:BatD family protein [Flavobacterium sp. J372]|uniref:BatD family protein n=1 Tax=Flavobacterium sp. J372 TaxID=2898436 RepID=UPI00215154AF|nr:BatD family protein [Flavobacterium sp. J372]MCR5861086.1 BatD family protein [Flavobacterium sp. J372]